MKVLFDTSVLVPALVDQLPNHPVCFAAFQSYTSDENQGYCSTHCLAECYAVLTALPLSRRVTTSEAWMLINGTILEHLKVVALNQAEYGGAIERVSKSGYTGGIVYDAIHIAAAEKADCSRILTNNNDYPKPKVDEEI